ncbi:MAG: response regulator transcription factor [Pseudomonadota bacterium]|jgi:DNA-binding NarL/FixJ family response regulator|nr:response regulator transcription factor [Pseudomonadota bacterium]|tara:strand:- start:57 stop:701 length:645 start_codon:yes stop_codon:yes gene_type:complete
MKKIKVILVDDHAVVRAGYKILLKNIDYIDVIAEADTGEEAIELSTKLRPNVVVMDISLPGINGIEAIRRIVSNDHDIKVLVFTMHEEVVFVERALQAGAIGYMTKSTDPKLLSKAIKHVSQGKKYIDDDLRQKMTYEYEQSREGDSLLSDLSAREFQIFCLLAEGKNTNEISKELNISYKTVANYSSQIKNKLQASTVADIARIAIRHNIIKA